MPVIGIEIGGTKLQVGVGEATGTLVCLVRRAVEPARGASGIRRMLVEMVAQALAEAGVDRREVGGIGIGFGGPYDCTHERVVRSFQIEGWTGFPLRQWAEEQWGAPVMVRNDAAVAGLGEALRGAGHGCRRVFYLGQGIGAAEIGHTWAPDPESGQLMELEQICSGWSIGRRARKVVEPASRMAVLAGSVDAIDAAVVYAAAEQGDVMAQSLLRVTAETLGFARGNMATLLHPELIVIGGGVSKMGALLWEPLREATLRRVMAPFAAGVRIEPALLGDAVVVVGGCCLADQPFLPVSVP
ncbi:MAG: ROK family protein [Anaerolineales bacterium]|nr:ROK family protein [Anaerolineales bacterium]